MYKMRLHQTNRRDLIFHSLSWIDHKEEINEENYVVVNYFESEQENVMDALEEMFCHFNGGCEYFHRSMSISDVVEVFDDETSTKQYYFCDNFGYKVLDDFEIKD